MLEKKTCLTKEILLELAKVLIIESDITIVPKDETKAFLKKAQHICPDPDDVMYFATALKLKCSIWSNDKKLKDQNQIPVYSTHDIKKLF
ncbi:MAG: PIN domain-containing protein [Candidatus Thermoplasmatota archaeon]|nr:PIN domain-containing protein [Candidatus Thermoplasmatota archaeon]